MRYGKVLIVVPVYNEEDLITQTIDGLKKIDLIDEIVIINDGSTDNTARVLDELDVNVISLEENHGKGYAMKKAIEVMDYDYIGFVDGDLGLTSSEIEKLIYPVVYNNVDFTIAKFPERSIKTNSKGGFGLVKGLAKMGVYLYTNKKMDTSLSGQRIYKKEVIDAIEYIPIHYGIEVAMTIQALKNGFTFEEIPVNMTHRYSERSLEGFRHRGNQFLDILKTLIVMLFRR
ncbi:glycosyltransferase family 2 protein [Schnuerera sp. xch1]|uniref:glycosyltransferase family 2 protein n=1 Tax=Schnuerera sp. xch1 TaxID=2874283 RepID=UPI001CBB943A|nr:glycosyltransferase family 2 protein [Schnuerera sp. xch1]MBZ2173766.1 glycosyltransferase family 2 protein [Schnuerera sp. xch1]